MIIMSVDLGKARTGIAVCDKTEFLASPYTVIFEKSPKQLLEKVSNTAYATQTAPKQMQNSQQQPKKQKPSLLLWDFRKIWTAVRAKAHRMPERLPKI